MYAGTFGLCRFRIQISFVYQHSSEKIPSSKIHRNFTRNGFISKEIRARRKNFLHDFQNFPHRLSIQSFSLWRILFSNPANPRSMNTNTWAKNSPASKFYLLPKSIVIGLASRRDTIYLREMNDGEWKTWNYVRSAHSRAVAAHTRVVPSEYLSGRIAAVCTRFWRMQKGISLP